MLTPPSGSGLFVACLKGLVLVGSLQKLHFPILFPPFTSSTPATPFGGDVPKARTVDFVFVFPRDF